MSEASAARAAGMRAVICVGLTALASCYTPCKSSTECDKGEHCDFTTGQCLAGCSTDDHCTGRCDLETGRCLAVTLDPPPDSGQHLDASTSSTSTSADAGP